MGGETTTIRSRDLPFECICARPAASGEVAARSRKGNAPVEHERREQEQVARRHSGDPRDRRASVKLFGDDAARGGGRRDRGGVADQDVGGQIPPFGHRLRRDSRDTCGRLRRVHGRGVLLRRAGRVRLRAGLGPIQRALPAARAVDRVVGMAARRPGSLRPPDRRRARPPAERLHDARLPRLHRPPGHLRPAGGAGPAHQAPRDLHRATSNGRCSNPSRPWP